MQRKTTMGSETPKTPIQNSKKTTMNFESLPSEVLASIVNQATGGESMENLLLLANAETAVKRVVQDWKCAGCDDNIFLVGDEKNDSRINFATENKVPYQCNACGGNYCARTQNETCKNKSNGCAACSKLECRSCVAKSLCVACEDNTFFFCQGCQGDLDLYMECETCEGLLCDKHACWCDCEKCGKVACFLGGCYQTRWCDVCESQICQDCTFIWYCDTCHSSACLECGLDFATCSECGLTSCNAWGQGNGNPSCPTDFQRLVCASCTYDSDIDYY